jgi:hypothetical protein
MCPMEEDLGMLMSSLVIYVHTCWQEREKKGVTGVSKGTKNEAVDSEHEASKDRGSQLCIKSHYTK